ncbi:NAD(P)H-dependent oxidoreductase [Malikia spinosa]|uniref:NAD(P)H-dependent oxidoreductase n=1 Tax=Malikia spinosa TaxID=86180 RepID=UPI003FA1FCB3
MKILQINASARREGANSTKVANRVTERLQAANPGAAVTLRDLAANPVPAAKGFAQAEADLEATLAA